MWRHSGKNLEPPPTGWSAQVRTGLEFRVQNFNFAVSVLGFVLDSVG